ncbi:hypothetical protein RB599_003421 [Gaeumannomyces hyphopodioides]
MAAQSIPLPPSQPPPPSPGGNNTRGAEEPLLDFEPIDTQYANQEGKDNPTEYGKQPWRYMDGVSYSGDVANAYLSIRFDKREDFVANLDEQKKKRVKHEMERIKKTLERFRTYEDKKAMLEDLEKARNTWKSGVYDTLLERRKEVERDSLPKKMERRDRYLVLLGRLESQAKSRPKEETTTPEPPRQEIPSAPSGGIHVPELLGPDCGFKASAMYFQRPPGRDNDDDDIWEGCDSPHDWFKGSKFPNQKISTQKLLEKHEKNPLTKREDDRLRWFHFPANNMGWVEKAMARYYDEDDVARDKSVKPHSQMSQAERLLCREFWHGQLHGSGEKAPIHARHMRSRFFLIPRKPPAAAEASAQDTDRDKASPPSPHRAMSGTGRKTMQNIAMFIPYLHWEANGRRAQMVHAMNNADGIPEARKRAIARRKVARKKVAEVVKTAKPRGNRYDKDKASPAGNHMRFKLGRYLMQLARVAEAIDSEMDEKLLKENLYKEPPLHARRTLDQYYFLTLEDTSVRDRDQVVYRETWDRRGSYGRSTRVVMVDQLWLWVLDDNTIITSFPRRWGRNKPDPSGVHKCLRDRLANNRKISSIYHLALMIIDQCSSVFFDRTKPLDQRPEVIDIFGSAIGHVTDMTAITYDLFWSSSSAYRGEIFSSGFRSASSSDQQRESKKTNQRYLDINPAGALLREGRDIAEELKIMHRVFSQQWQVVKDFRRYLGQLARCGRGGGKETLRSLIKSLEVLIREEADDDWDWDRRSQVRPLPNTTAADTTTAAASSTAGSFSRSMPRMQSARSEERNASPGLLLEDTLQEADMLLENIGSRQAEIQDLEDSACRTCAQVESLLSLKQQQASIFEAKAALDSAGESVKQGRSIMAFTIVTIFFLPLGFFAGFFGMNNQLSTGNGWMTLGEQVGYMFGLSSVVIIVAVSIAFSSWVRALLTYLVRVPLLLLANQTGCWELWDAHAAGLEKQNSVLLGKVKRERAEKKEAKEKKEANEKAEKEKAEKEKAAACATPSASDRKHGNASDAESVWRLNGRSTATGGPATGDADVESGRGSELGSAAAGWFPLRSRNRTRGGM